MFLNAARAASVVAVAVAAAVAAGVAAGVAALPSPDPEHVKWPSAEG